MESSVALPAVAALKVSALVRRAFDGRVRPSSATESSELTHDERAELEEMFRLDWRETTSAHWERLAEVVSWLSPEAFCYYLPGILIATLDEYRPNLIAAGSVLFMLDRTPSTDMWDDFFFARWTRLNREELEAVGAWVTWLSTLDNFMLDDTSLTRALLTIDLLRERIDRA